MKMLTNDTRQLYVPTHLLKLTILPLLHRKIIKRYETNEETIKLPAIQIPECDIIK